MGEAANARPMMGKENRMLIPRLDGKCVRRSYMSRSGRLFLGRDGEQEKKERTEGISVLYMPTLTSSYINRAQYHSTP